MNILSIDIDALFKCHTYANHMNHDIDAVDSWDLIYFLENTNKYGIDTSIDKQALFKTIEILQKKCLNSEVVFIEEHDEIVKVMSDRGCKDSVVYNIDYHHDLTYNNDDDTLTIENWVRHAKPMIKEYYWVCRPLSDIRVDSPIRYYRNCLEDVIVEKMNNIDLVVICTSHHFTPKKYWNTLPKYLMSYIPYIQNFKEVCKTNLTYDMLKNLQDYLIDGKMPNISRLFRYKDCYVVYEDDENSLSIVNLGKGFGIGVCKEVVDYIVKCYGYATFTYVKGIRNEVLINRLLKNYCVIEKEENDNIIKIKFKGVDFNG